jgi:hypothetical protein
MLLRIATVGAVLAVGATLPTSCTGTNTAPDSSSSDCVTSSSPTTATTTIPGGTWRVESPNTSIDCGVTSYTVTCTPTGGPGSWREVAVPASKGESYATGDPCPTGPVLGSADCGPSGPTNVHPDNGETNAEAVLLCGGGNGSYSQDQSILDSVADQPGQ